MDEEEEFVRPTAVSRLSIDRTERLIEPCRPSALFQTDTPSLPTGPPKARSAHTSSGIRTRSRRTYRQEPPETSTEKGEPAFHQWRRQLYYRYCRSWHERGGGGRRGRCGEKEEIGGGGSRRRIHIQIGRGEGRFARSGSFGPSRRCSRRYKLIAGRIWRCDGGARSGRTGGGRGSTGARGRDRHPG